MIRLGDRIKELRQHDGRTQEYLAGKLGVTAQAISRWENGICYPDMELVPSIANCFGVTIDELFGYWNDREQRIDAILKTVDGYDIQSRADDEWIEPCLAALREGLIEFPGNEKLLVTLCDTLSEAGWRRFEERSMTTRDFYNTESRSTARIRSGTKLSRSVKAFLHPPPIRPLWRRRSRS